MLVMLLGVAGFRMLSSSPASAAPVAPALAEKPAPAAPAIEVSPEPTPAPKPQVKAVPKPAAPRAPQPDVPPPPLPRRVTMNNFAPAPSPNPATPKAIIVDGTLPDASVDVGEELPAVDASLSAPPPPEAKPGRTGKIVRSVGRIFKIGKKETPEQ